MNDTGLCVMMVIIIIGLIADMIYIRSLEKRIDVLQQWVEFFLKIDFNRLTRFVSEERKRSKHE